MSNFSLTRDIFPWQYLIISNLYDYLQKSKSHRALLKYFLNGITIIIGILYIFRRIFIELIQTNFNHQI